MFVFLEEKYKIIKTKKDSTTQAVLYKRVAIKITDDIFSFQLKGSFTHHCYLSYKDVAEKR